MNKITLMALVISLFGLTGCGDDPAPAVEKPTIEKGNAIGRAEEAVKQLNKKTEDQLAQEDFERLISEPKKIISTNEKVRIQIPKLEDIEILDVTDEDLESIK